MKRTLTRINEVDARILNLDEDLVLGEDGNGDGRDGDDFESSLGLDLAGLHVGWDGRHGSVEA